MRLFVGHCCFDQIFTSWKRGLKTQFNKFCKYLSSIISSCCRRSSIWENNWSAEIHASDAGCEKFGTSVCKVIDEPEKLRKYERFFWFTIEFGLVKINEVKQIFGEGIASSLGECDYALSNVPEVIDFEIDCIVNQEFKIDEMQNKLFILKSVNQLYSSLDELNNKLQN